MPKIISSVDAPRRESGAWLTCRGTHFRPDHNRQFISAFAETTLWVVAKNQAGGWNTLGVSRQPYAVFPISSGGGKAQWSPERSLSPDFTVRVATEEVTDSGVPEIVATHW